MSAKDKKLLVGVDFGATKILAAVFSPKLKLLGQEKKKTEADQGVGGTIRKIAKAIREALIEADSRLEDVAAIGIGAPAPVDPKKGLIIDAPNLGWKNVPLRDELEKVLKVPVFVENDVNVGTLGVQQCGAARGARSVVGIFVGTGVGGGIVLDGEIFSGAGHMAGEIGHMIVDPSSRHKEATGMAGTLEALASRLSINRQIRQAVSR
ncbi:MAG: ROK family protein, partial [Verrucomicrobiae bacterium]|nr:ROK family protein [Verrucomicrobiae bacterium]